MTRSAGHQLICERCVVFERSTEMLRWISESGCHGDQRGGGGWGVAEAGFAGGQRWIKPSGSPCQIWGPFLSFPFSHSVSPPLFSETFPPVIKINNTLFAVLNLRSTTYSKKLVAERQRKLTGHGYYFYNYICFVSLLLYALASCFCLTFYFSNAKNQEAGSGGRRQLAQLVIRLCRGRYDGSPERSKGAIFPLEFGYNKHNFA